MENTVAWHALTAHATKAPSSNMTSPHAQTVPAAPSTARLQLNRYHQAAQPAPSQQAGDAASQHHHDVSKQAVAQATSDAASPTAAQALTAATAPSQHAGHAAAQHHVLEACPRQRCACHAGHARPASNWRRCRQAQLRAVDHIPASRRRSRAGEAEQNL